MKIIGFNFTKISAFKNEEFKKSNLDADIKFTDLEKQKVDFLKEEEAIRVKFKHALSYKDSDSKKKELLAEVILEGNIALSLTKEESKEIDKLWKKKELPQNMNFFLYNFILKKCAYRALQLQEELNLPSHIPIPRLTAQKQN